jgi:hypothetical protein
MYTKNSALMANEEDKRGTLEAGKFADLAVLSSDYLTAPAGEIGKIRSVLTMVGGKVVFAAAPFTGLGSGNNIAPSLLCMFTNSLIGSLHRRTIRCGTIATTGRLSAIICRSGDF